jgi:hypothetical protein
LTSVELERFFASYMRELSEDLRVRAVINSTRCEEIRALAKPAKAAYYAPKLRLDRPLKIPELGLNLQLKRLREMNGRNFYHIEVLVNQRRVRKRRVCFVGHRFKKQVGKTLRWNLAQVLEPYRIDIDWSGQDPRSVQIFDDIVRRIKHADFCVFDTRSTTGKPNVYIEAGIAYAVRTPFILFDYVPENTDGRRAQSFPSDLAHALSLRYSSYEQLFRDFYFSLPAFAKNNF